jgi:hypothetical protein
VSGFADPAPIEAWLNDGGRRVGKWRRDARIAMRRAVESWLNTHPRDALVAHDILHAVDMEYPFGQRKYHPYDAWLTERKILRQALGLMEKLPEPTDEDFAAVEVAIDLVESGRFDEALALLAEQAPRRLNRDCPVCGAKRGRDCWSASGSIVALPHLGRVMPSRVNGPLFGGAA